MAKTSIAWTEKVWNPTRGCSKVSDGCKHCYAERMAGRFSGKGQPYEGLVTLPYFTTRTVEHRDMDGNYTGQDDYDVKVASRWTGEARFIPEMLDAPLRWKKPSLIFANSMSDLFHEDITDEQIAEVFGVMAVAAKTFFGPRIKGRLTRDFGPHVFQILTKRANRLRLLSTERFRGLVARAAYRHAMDRVDAGWLHQCISGRRESGNHCTLDPMWPLPNVHLGVSVENQDATERIEMLLRCPAAVRWVSCEPLLAAVDLTDITVSSATGVDHWNALECEYDDKLGRNGPRIDWVVAGGESGPGARPMHPDNVRSLRDQCKAANVPFFFKQHGEYVSVYDRDTEDPDWRRCSDVSAAGSPGQWLNIAGGTGFHGERVQWMERVGKKRAGNLLDGVRYEMRPGDKWDV